MRRLFWGLVCCFISMYHVGHALAATYAVAPFQINGAKTYSYLSKSIPSMISSRLFVAGENEPSKGQDLLMGQKAPTSKTQAQNLRDSVQADFLIYGSITIIGDHASLDMSVVGNKDLFWQKAFQTPMNNMLASIQDATNSINSEIFNRDMTTASNSTTKNVKQSKTTKKTSGNGQNSEDIDQTSRSAMLDFESLGFEIADFNNDGKMEVALLKSNYLYIYRYENQTFTLLTELKIPNNIDPLRVRAYTHKGTVYTVFSGHNTSSNKPSSQIYRYEDNELKQVVRVSYYLNVAKPSMYDGSMLLGQQGDSTRFLRGHVFEVNFDGTKVTKGRNYSQFPKEANLYNFTWLPGADEDGGNHFIVIDDQDKMLTFDSKGKRLAKSQEIYASSGINVSITRDMTGFESREGRENLQYYYVPMRCIPTDFDKDGKYELLTSKPVSTAAIIFESYRTFIQGDVRALMWDGMGMAEEWKTRTIKGTIMDIDVADPDNDGVMDLVVNVNTHPGTFGLGDIRTMLLLYPLNIPSE